ncbi:hypothetical protein [Streptomyces sp. KMM 9044]|uniref:hypothetical protein n=1 Tax=Streptomyces sp. KMM 9044 TaxID=2744474 RepID=UPI002151495E|nr:hypothetical protein [Streptomyces sp. KMM 9044]WAX79018.1 hypothetical protein HUV60_016380 [Streptomyces sp. KMM 9044]
MFSLRIPVRDGVARVSAGAVGEAGLVAEAGEVCRQPGVRRAKPTAQPFSHRAMPDLCGQSMAVKARTPNSLSGSARSLSCCR